MFEELDDTKIPVEASLKNTGNLVEDYNAMITKLKLPKNTYFERFLGECSEKGQPDELFIQNLSLDKITLRMLFTLIDYTKCTRFRFYECRLSKNGFIVLNSFFAKIEKGSLSLEVSFNPLEEPKAFNLLFTDKFTVLSLRCNNLDINFAKEATESLIKLQKTEMLNFYGNKLGNEGSQIVFEALTSQSH